MVQRGVGTYRGELARVAWLVDEGGIALLAIEEARHLDIDASRRPWNVLVFHLVYFDLILIIGKVKTKS